MTVSEILDSINRYALAYADIERIQEESPLIPKGDQKTGCIGELYAYLFLAHTHPDATLMYGSHSEKGWDIECSTPSNSRRIQVKTVSAFSKTRTISPIHHGWDELFVVFLNRTFEPTGFWIITDNSIVANGEILKGCRCRDPEKQGTGTPTLPFGTNRAPELRTAIEAQVR